MLFRSRPRAPEATACGRLPFCMDRAAPTSSRGGSVCLTSPSSESQSARLAPRCSLSLLLELGSRGGGQCISPSQETPRPPLESRRLRWGGVGAEKMRQHICCSGCYYSEVALLDLPSPAPSPCSCSNPGVLTEVVFLG